MIMLDESSAIASMLGVDAPDLTIENTLNMIGSMIATAQRDENGQLTDHGRLMLTVGELFVQNIFDYDEGFTLGAAIGPGSVSPTVGGKDASGETRATIGKTTNHIETTANRDVNKVKAWRVNYDVDPITAYIPTESVPELPKTKGGDVDWGKVQSNVVGGVTGAIGDLAKIVGFKKDPAPEDKSAASSPQEEEIQRDESTSRQDTETQDISDQPTPREEALEAIRGANSAYGDTNREVEDEVEKSTKKSHFKLIKLINNKTPTAPTGAQANIVEKTSKSGKSSLDYNIEGTDPIEWKKWSWIETIKDISSNYALGLSGRAIGKIQSAIAKSLMHIGEAVARDDSSATSFPDLTNVPGWDQIPDEAHFHIGQMEQYRREIKQDVKFNLNGHSKGGALAIAINALRPDLVSAVNAIDPPGTLSMVKHIAGGDEQAIKRTYSNTKIYLANPNAVNTIDEHSDYASIFFVRSPSHRGEAIGKYCGDHGVTKISSHFYKAGGQFNQETGDYWLTRKLFTTEAQVAKELNIDQSRVHKVLTATELELPIVQFRVEMPASQTRDRK